LINSRIPRKAVNFAVAADSFRKTCRDGEVIAESSRPKAMFVSCSKIRVDEKEVVREKVRVPGYDTTYVVLDAQVWDTGEKTSAVLCVLRPFP
jgi:hypothetical protein